MQTQVKNGNLIITVPLKAPKDAPLSHSGKNKVLFSSGGFQDADDHRINLTVIPSK